MALFSLQVLLQALTARAEAAEKKEKTASEEAESLKKEVTKLTTLVTQFKACGKQPCTERKIPNTRCRSWLIAHGLLACKACVVDASHIIMLSRLTFFAECKSAEPAAAPRAQETAARAGLFSCCYPSASRRGSASSPHIGHSHASHCCAGRAQGCGPSWTSAHWSPSAPSPPISTDANAKACCRDCRSHSTCYSRPACGSLGCTYADTSSCCHQSARGACWRQDRRASERGTKSIARRGGST